MAVAALRILCRLMFPTQTVRLWLGSGPYIDTDGFTWHGVTVLDESSLDVIELAINGESYTLNLGLSGLAYVETSDGQVRWADMAYEELDEVIGAKVHILIQDCDEFDQPIGSPEVYFTGTVENIVFSDTVNGDAPQSTVMIECANRFTLRGLSSGSVLSDTDQRLVSARLNPGADPDKFCERIPTLADKTIVWPRVTN